MPCENSRSQAFGSRSRAAQAEAFVARQCQRSPDGGRRKLQDLKQHDVRYGCRLAEAEWNEHAYRYELVHAYVARRGR